MNGKELKRVENSKFLGLIYDFNIKWDIYVSSIIKKSKYLVYVFYRLNPVLMTLNQRNNFEEYRRH